MYGGCVGVLAWVSGDSTGTNDHWVLKVAVYPSTTPCVHCLIISICEMFCIYVNIQDLLQVFKVAE